MRRLDPQVCTFCIECRGYPCCFDTVSHTRAFSPDGLTEGARRASRMAPPASRKKNRAEPRDSVLRHRRRQSHSLRFSTGLNEEAIEPATAFQLVGGEANQGRVPSRTCKASGEGRLALGWELNTGSRQQDMRVQVTSKHGLGWTPSCRSTALPFQPQAKKVKISSRTKAETKLR